MSRRAALLLCLTIAAALVLLRTVPFMAPGVRFDADQAVVGLMAKHISEGRAFPVYFYGQSYLLAVEAYLAAPVMWLLGPTEVALKVPLLLLNVAAVVLLVWRACRDAGHLPWLGLVASLPVALPAVTPGSRLMDAMGGNVEPLLYTLALWCLRSRPWLFAAALGVFVAHREFTLLPAGVLGALDLWHRRSALRAVAWQWTAAVVMLVAVQAGLAAVRPYGAMFGPGSRPHDDGLNLSAGDAIRAQVCLSPPTWPDRARRIVGDHLPLMAGGIPGPMQDVSISSGMGHGRPGLAPWMLALTLAAVAAGVVGPRRERSLTAAANPVAPEARGAPPAIPPRALPWFLLGTGVLSTLVYGFVACSQISQATLRYDLLALYIPVGALLAGLGARPPAVRAGLVAATLIWASLTASDYAALAGEIRRGQWRDYRGEAVAALEARGLRTLWGDFRLAYVLSFRSQERVIVAPTSVHRIDLYARHVAADAGAPLVKQGACGGGHVLVGGIWLCPPLSPGQLPPVY